MNKEEACIAFYKLPKQYKWKPQADITAYELALAVPIVAFHTFDQEAAIDALPEQVRRHFEEVAL